MVGGCVMVGGYGWWLAAYFYLNVAVHWLIKIY